MIKNEEDIIETFVRYTMCFAYKMVIIDNGSTDGTVEIIKELKKEGFRIDLYIEANSFYEQIIIENKYLKLIKKKEKCDFILPIDADEFLYPISNDFNDFDLLSTDKITVLKWRTYCLDSCKNINNIFKDIVLRRSNADEFTKVIVPYKLAEKIFLTMGHHDIDCKEEINKDYIDNMVIAHFPVRSETQIKLKLYQGILSQLMSSYHHVVAFHWQEMFEKLQEGNFDIINYSKTYALKNDSKPVYVKEPLNIDWCADALVCKYNSKIKNKIEDVIFSIAEMIAIRSIVGGAGGQSALRKLVIYGTGNSARKIFEYFKPSNFEIIAYVDSDKNKEFSIYEGRLIIAPDKLKYIDYDLIVIASIYKDEIYQILCEEGINREKIIGSIDLLQEEIEYGIYNNLGNRESCS